MSLVTFFILSNCTLPSLTLVFVFAFIRYIYREEFGEDDSTKAKIMGFHQKSRFLRSSHIRRCSLAALGTLD